MSSTTTNSNTSADTPTTVSCLSFYEYVSLTGVALPLVWGPSIQSIQWVGA